MPEPFCEPVFSAKTETEPEWSANFLTLRVHSLLHSGIHGEDLALSDAAFIKGINADVISFHV